MHSAHVENEGVSVWEAAGLDRARHAAPRRCDRACFPGSEFIRAAIGSYKRICTYHVFADRSLPP
jgi:hypothetical protein